MADRRIVAASPDAPGYHLIDVGGKLTYVNADNEADARRRIAEKIQGGMTEAAEQKQQEILQASQNMSPWQQFKQGLGTAVGEVVEGGKALFGSETDPNTAAGLERARQISNASPAGYAGSLAADIAGTAPLAMGLRLAGKAGSVPAAVRSLGTPFGSEALATGAYEALKLPSGEPDTLGARAQQAGLGALASGVATGVPLVMGGVHHTPAVADLLAKGVRLTPGQAGGEVARTIEQGLGAVPLLGTSIKAQQRRALQDWNKSILDRVAPTGKVTGLGTEGMSDLAKQFDTAYAGIFDKLPDKIDFRSVAGDINAVGTQYKPRMSPESQVEFDGEIQNLMTNMVDPATALINKTDIKRSAKEFDKLATNAMNRGNMRLGEAYTEVAQLINKSKDPYLTPEVKMEADALDAKYAEYIPIQQAHALQGAVSQGYITPDQLLQGTKASDRSLRKAAFARGHRPMQDEAMQAGEVFRNEIPRVGPGTAEKMTTGGLLGVAALNPAIGVPLLGALAGSVPAAKLAMPMLAGRVPYLSPTMRAIYGTGTEIFPGALGQTLQSGFEYLSQDDADIYSRRDEAAERALIPTRSGAPLR